MISRISTKIIIVLSMLKHPLYGGVGTERGQSLFQSLLYHSTYNLSIAVIKSKSK